MFNRTLFFGEGLFETIRWKPSDEKLKLHYQRLSTSARTLGVPYPNYGEFKNQLENHVPTQGEFYVKYILMSEGDDYFAGASEGYTSLVVVKPLKAMPKSVKLCVSPYRRHSSDPVCRHKTTSYLFNTIVKKQALSKGFWDGVILNERDCVCETSSSNLIFLKGSQFYTPAVSEGLLPGTTLEFLSKRLEIRDERISIKDVENYDGVFVLNSLILCAQVERIEDVNLKRDALAFEELNSILRACLHSPQAEGLPDR
ncbi:MAG: aminotransferase class IV [Aquificaceae bacterium]|nr:aminotransferase class IV [Aquificaceae bacterium]MDW8433734.1 aminotransferase class IV [Aquificaceae bacterium]